jgi:hypothetical protein
LGKSEALKHLIAIWFALSTVAGYCGVPTADSAILVQGVELFGAERFDEARE